MVEYRHPVKGVVTQGYKANPNNGINGPGGHTGKDIACAEGTPVRAAGDGIIEYSGWGRDLPGGIRNKWAFLPDAAGGLVVINHGVGEPNSHYGHMMETYFNEGDFVKGGTIIGLADTTGLATGSHLHYEFMAPVYNLVPPMWGRVNPDDYCRGYWDDAPVPGGGLVDDVVDNIFIAGEGGVRRREAPDKNAPLKGEEFAPGARLVIGGYVRTGIPPYPNTTDIWLVGGLTGGYMWLGSFVNQDVSAIPDLTAAITPPDPVVPPVVVAPPYDFPLDLTLVNGITVEKAPAHNTNVDTGNMPAAVLDVVKHWWNDIPNRPDITSVISGFQKEGEFKSPHFVVGEYRIVQMVALKDRAYHAGPEGNDKWGIEIDPYVTEMVDGRYTERAMRIQANVRELHRALEGYAGRELRARLHKEFMNTRCAEIDLLTVEPDRSVPVQPTPPDEIGLLLNELETFIREFRKRKLGD